MKFLFPISDDDLNILNADKEKKHKKRKKIKWLIFENPIKVIKLYHNYDTEKLKNDIQDFFRSLESENLCFSGFFSYDLIFYFYSIKRKEQKNSLMSLPLIYGGFFSHFKIIDNIEEVIFPDSQKELDKSCFLNEIHLLENISKYKNNIEYIRSSILEGKVYQVNYAFPIEFKIYGNLYNLFYILWKKQQSLNACMILDKDFYVISLSPELFFYQNRENIILKPMKGSFKKSKSLRNVIYAVKYLKHSKKEIAENAMITDLIRNDVGKISKIGTVKIENLFKIEIYNTIIQMITEIHSKLQYNCKKEYFWFSLFPSGSVTGAPKLSAIKFIESIETYRRHIYTGSIGWIIGDFAKFNVAIRTIIGNQSKAFYYVGSGITFDSLAKREFYECISKAKILKEVQKILKPEFIFTTMKFSGGIIYFEKSHLQRLNMTKTFFHFCISYKKILNRFTKIKNKLKKFSYPVRIHFRIYKNGKIQIFLDKLNIKKNIVFCISDITTNKEDIFLQFKTSNRNIYNYVFDKVQDRFDEVIFKNKEGYLTEGSYTNLIIKKNNKFYTPPLECGVLNGIMRQKLIQRYKVIERNLKEEDLKNAEQIYLVNSVRGILKGIFR